MAGVNNTFDFFAANQGDVDSWSDHSDDIQLPDASIAYFPRLFSQRESERLFEDLFKQVNWQQETILMHGKQLKVPRLSAWYGTEGISYTYSGILHHPNAWIAPLLTIKQRVEQVALVQFNSVLCNLYRDGQDSVAWHSDDEVELGSNPVIASISLGEERCFQLRRRDDHLQKFRLNLQAGSCLLMSGKTQHFWQHQIAKVSATIRPRINLTFRRIR